MGTNHFRIDKKLGAILYIVLISFWSGAILLCIKCLIFFMIFPLEVLLHSMPNLNSISFYFIMILFLESVDAKYDKRNCRALISRRLAPLYI